MSVSTTANLGLTLPYQTDPVAVSEQNSNMGLIDGFAGDEWANMGIVETGVTATHAIAAGQYVIWKGILYTADSAISVGTTLSRGGSGSSGTKNLTPVSNGGFNALNSKITDKMDVTSQFTLGPTITLQNNDSNYFKVYKTGNIIELHFRGSTSSTLSDPVICTAPSGMRPKHPEALSVLVGSAWDTSKLAMVNYYSTANAFVFGANAYTKNVNYPFTIQYICE